jgi:hypothetical protein
MRLRVMITDVFSDAREPEPLRLRRHLALTAGVVFPSTASLIVPLDFGFGPRFAHHFFLVGVAGWDSDGIPKLPRA